MLKVHMAPVCMIRSDTGEDGAKVQVCNYIGPI